MRKRLDVDLLRRALLAPDQPWREVSCHDSVDSTNAVAGRLGTAWLVVVADHQSAGRGRLRRSWQAPPGSSVAVSVVLPLPPAGWGWMPLLAGLAVARAIEELTGLAAGLKWPNDVLLTSAGDRKVAGVLCELSPATPRAGPPAVVVGAGINVDQGPAELPAETATSLRLAGADVSREDLAVRFLTRLAEAHAAAGLADDATRPTAGPGWSLQAYRERCVTLGREVLLHRPAGEPVRGTAVDVDEHGRLVVEGPAGRIAWAAGDVVHLRAPEPRRKG